MIQHSPPNPERNDLYLTALRRIKDNKDYRVVFTGDTGSGKTYAAIRMAYDLDTNFTKENICLSSVAFLERIYRGKIKKGGAIVYEEAGVNVGARDWQSKVNIALGQVFQTIRRYNLIILFTMPRFNMLDKNVRNLCHIKINMDNPIYKAGKPDGYSVGTPKIIDVKEELDKTFYPYPRTSKGVAITGITFPMIDKALAKAYEDEKYVFTQALLEKTLKVVGSLNPQENAMYELNQKGHTQQQVADKLGVTQVAVSAGLKRASIKGYKVLKGYALSNYGGTT